MDGGRSAAPGRDGESWERERLLAPMEEARRLQEGWGSSTALGLDVERSSAPGWDGENMTALQAAKHDAGLGDQGQI